MYDIAKTRMLLTTVVFAAVAALFAAGANARIPADTGSAFAAQESLGIGRYAVLPSVTNVAQGSGTFSVEEIEICAALDLEQLRGVLINEPAIKAVTPGAIQECLDAGAAKPITPVLASSEATHSVEEICVALDPQECLHAGAAKPIAPVLASSEATQGVSESAVISRSDVVSRYLDNNRKGTSQKRLAQPRPNKFPDGRRSSP